MSIIRKVYFIFLHFCLLLSIPYMLWSALKVLTNCCIPILAIQSGGLGPLNFLRRGDVLFLTNYESEPIRAGEIIVFTVPDRNIPIAHRVIKVHEKADGDVQFLTKGDDNSIDDRGLYPPGQLWLKKKDVIGRAKGYFPFIGIIAVMVMEDPYIKYELLAWICFHAVTT